MDSNITKLKNKAKEHKKLQKKIKWIFYKFNFKHGKTLRTIAKLYGEQDIQVKVSDDVIMSLNLSWNSVYFISFHYEQVTNFQYCSNGHEVTLRNFFKTYALEYFIKNHEVLLSQLVEEFSDKVIRRHE